MELKRRFPISQDELQFSYFAVELHSLLLKYYAAESDENGSATEISFLTHCDDYYSVYHWKNKVGVFRGVL